MNKTIKVILPIQVMHKNINLYIVGFTTFTNNEITKSENAG